MPDILDEYRTISDGAVWRERLDYGRLRFTGADTISFLQALVSNDVASLAPGAGAYATYLTPQGRMLADLRVFRQVEAVLAVVPADLAASLAARMGGLLFAEDVVVADVSGAIAQVVVAGAGAAAVLAETLRAAEDTLRTLAPLAHVTAGEVVIARSDDLSTPAYDLFFRRDQRASMLTALESAGVRPATADLIEALRIEAGRPKFGVDMTGETIPLEAGLLDRGINTSKGCYVGQEIIIRVLHRGGGRVARRLVQLAIDPPFPPPPAGASILVDNQLVGRVTSAAFSPRLSQALALGYVARAAAEPGTRATLIDGDRQAPAEIIALAG
jgi:tRNA-modifying protein YgfZ